MADNSLKVSSLAPKYGHNRITNARFIQGGYFVVEKYEDLFSEDIGLTAAEGVYDDDGAIVVGSLCYCQKDNTRYMCTAIDPETKAMTWKPDNQGGGIIGGGIENETPTKNLVFNPLSDGTWEVSGEKDESDSTGCKTKNDYTNVVIPSAHNGAKVTKIAGHAFDGCSDLKTVVIPNTITFIDEKAFHNCTSLEFVEIPPSVTNLGVTVGAKYPGGEVFKGCSSLKWVSIPLSVKIIGFHTFLGCTKAEIFYEGKLIPPGWYLDDYGTSWNPSNCVINMRCYVELLKDVTTTNSAGNVYKTSKGLLLQLDSANDEYTVKGIGQCSDSIVVIPESYKGKRITAIGNYAFENCSITQVKIPKGVTTIGAYAFSGCTKLRSVSMPNTVTNIGGNVGNVFLNCSSLETIAIPYGVNKIGAHTFRGCSSLTIFCEARDISSNWSGQWNSSGCPVVMNAFITGEVTVLEHTKLVKKCTALEEQQKTNASNIQENAKALLTLVTLLSTRLNEFENLKAEMEALGCKFIYNP